MCQETQGGGKGWGLVSEQKNRGHAREALGNVSIGHKTNLSHEVNN